MVFNSWLDSSVKRQISKCWLKFFLWLGRSWGSLWCIMRAGLILQTLIKLLRMQLHSLSSAGEQMGRWRNALRISDFPWSQAGATPRTGKRQQAGIALSSFLLCEIQNCCCKWGCTQFSNEACLKFLTGLFWGLWVWLPNRDISTEPPAKPQLQ